MAKGNHDNLWAVTKGQRARYIGAMVAMACANLCMFGAPLVAKYAIAVVVDKDVSKGAPLLVGPAEWLTSALHESFGSADAFLWYLWLSALLAIAITGIGGLFFFLRGVWAAVASEAIVRGLREALSR